IASDADAAFDDEVVIDGSALAPHVTWGITPAQSVAVDESIPAESDFPESERPLLREAYEYMSLEPNQPIAGVPVDVVFIGSCTNGRISDLQEAADAVTKARKANPGLKVASSVRAMVVPGSEPVQKIAEEMGLDKIFTDAGFQWREPGCSMCLAMN